MREAIKGFHQEGYWFLSNFHSAPTAYDGVVYPTSEHAYQAAKTLDLDEREKILKMPKAGQAKRAGEGITKSGKRREDWNPLQTMYEIVKSKFSVEPMKAKLLATGDAYLEETNTWGDTYWGVCNGVGENHLGMILMRVRGELGGVGELGTPELVTVSPDVRPIKKNIGVCEGNDYYRFPCGCRFKIIGPPKLEGGLPLLDIRVDELPYCRATYDLLASGNTKGIFQLESKLGRTYSKSLKPDEIEHLGALGSILRPGSLRSLDDNNISITRNFCHRKNKEDIEIKKGQFISSEVPKYHPVVDKILEKTYGCLIYQEQSLELAKKLAGFTLQEADSLRRAIGKKLAAEMAKVKYQFLEGCKKVGIITQEQAEEIFSWIEKSNRYSFNKSISPNTMLEISEGVFITADKIDIGMYVKAPNPETGEDHYVQVVDKYEHGDQDVYKTTTSNGKWIISTMEHKFLCSNDKMEKLTDVLLKGRKLVTNGYDFGKIVSIEKVGRTRTIDIEVDSKWHVFYGNGIASSNSHAISYGIRGYKTAYIKAHTPLAFYLIWLKFAHNNQDPKAEMSQLISDAKLFDIQVEPPKFTQLKKHFTTDGEKIYFGLTDVSGVGDSTVVKARQVVKEKEDLLNKKIEAFTWLEFLFHIAPHVKSDSMKSIILSGSLRDFSKLSRQQMLNDYEAVAQLTDKELVWLVDNAGKWNSLVDALYSLSLPKYQKPKKKSDPIPVGPFGGCKTKAREAKVRSFCQLLRNPPTTTRDTALSISAIEEKLLGIAISCSKVDACDISQVNMSCKDFLLGANSSNMIFGVYIDEIRMLKTKKGKDPGRSMAALTVSDGSGSMSDVVVFPDAWAQYGTMISVGNSIAIQGERQKSGSGLIVQKCFQLYM